MKRHRFRKPATQMSLFPFLAVLICTMGVLIVLLVLLVQQAQLDANAEIARKAETDEQSKQIETAAEDAQWLFDQLENERHFLREQTHDQASILTHLESHLRELRERAELVQAKEEALRQLAAGKHADLERLQQQREALRQVIAATEAELKKARQAAKGRPPAFAIIPYLGARGTHRRPVYIECVEDGLIIQPEGVRISSEDFGGLIGPGNPLDATLRAIREFYRGAGVAYAPYPLLIVRPSGTHSYAMARAAMRSWDDEFGYELVDAEMELRFPPRNESLAEELRRTVAAAKRRQQALAAAMPTAYRRGGNGAVAYVASRQGGFVAVGGGEQQVNRVGGFGQGADAHYSDGARGRAEQVGKPGEDPGRVSQGRGRAGNMAQGNARSQGGMGTAFGQRQGKNWGLPNSPPPASVGITRPIRIALHHDRVVFLPERGVRDTHPITIPLYGPLSGHVDAILSSVWRVMETWGLAVVGGYWQPVLQVQVAQGAERRYLEFERAFRNSGLVLKRANP